MATLSYKEYLQKRTQYQEEGSQLLLEREHACLFYDPGKGKTYPTIDALREVWRENSSKGIQTKVLILSTADSINKMWLVDIEPQKILPSNVVYISFPSAIQPKTQQLLLSMKWDIIIVDECHKVKSPTSKTSKLIFKLTKNCKYVWGLTGTPRANHDVDVFVQFHNLHVSQWGDISYSNFVDECCDCEQKFFGMQRFKVPIGINSKYKAGWERNLAMYSQRVTYDDTDKMPDLLTNIVKLPFVKTKEYKDTEEGILRVGETATTIIKLAAIAKMHQAANGYLYDIDKTIHRFAFNDKLNWLKLNLTDEPTLIVYRHIADLEDLQKQYPNATEDINDFKAGKSNLLLLQCSRCESFNLQNCARIIFYTLDYSYIKYKQMLHRCWRKGQKQSTQLDILIFDGSIENKIWKAVSGKKRLADLFMSIKGAYND